MTLTARSFALTIMIVNRQSQDGPDQPSHLSDHLFGPLDTNPEDTPEISNRALGLICAITFVLIAISLWSMQ